MTSLLQFGEQLPDYSVRVLNEREVRGGAGIMFFVALVAFMNAWTQGDFAPTQITVIIFFVDFFIRVLINPRFAPTLVLARIMVRNQTPEWVGAPQKRFAWSIGLGLASLMMVLVVFNHVRGPVNILTCAACLLLLFFESAFGICIGCKVYNLLHRDKAQLCPGDACEVTERQLPPPVSASQYATLEVSLLLMAAAISIWPEASAPQLASSPSTDQKGPVSAAEAQRCEVPEFAKRIGHEAKWKLHHGCP